MGLFNWTYTVTELSNDGRTVTITATRRFRKRIATFNRFYSNDWKFQGKSYTVDEALGYREREKLETAYKKHMTGNWTEVTRLPKARLLP